MTARPRADTIRVKESPIHGKGVFALAPIRAGKRIIEYAGARISADEAIRRSGQDPANPHHTFFFGLSDGSLIDGGDRGNDARWINHGCEPNCEATEDKGRIFIMALRDIEPGEELKYDYRIDLPEEQSASLKKSYECRCGAPACRKTMLGKGRPVRSRQFVVLEQEEGVVLKRYEPTGSAAALATLLQLRRGMAADEREIAAKLGLPHESAETPSLADVAQAASAFGLSAKEYRQLDLPQLMDLAPAIIQVKLKSSTRLSVFRGMRDEQALLADPVYGNIAMPLDKFRRAWKKGTALVI